MAQSKTKLFSITLGVCLGLFLVIDFIAGAVSSDLLAINAASAICREKGWQDGDLAPRNSEVFGWLLGKTAHIEMTTKNRNPPKTIRVTLRKTINLLEWHVVDYNEEPNDR